MVIRMTRLWNTLNGRSIISHQKWKCFSVKRFVVKSRNWKGCNFMMCIVIEFIRLFCTIEFTLLQSMVISIVLFARQFIWSLSSEFSYFMFFPPFWCADHVSILLDFKSIVRWKKMLNVSVLIVKLHITWWDFIWMSIYIYIFGRYTSPACWKQIAAAYQPQLQLVYPLYLPSHADPSPSSTRILRATTTISEDL